MVILSRISNLSYPANSCDLPRILNSDCVKAGISATKVGFLPLALSASFFLQMCVCLFCVLFVKLAILSKWVLRYSSTSSPGVLEEITLQSSKKKKRRTNLVSQNFILLFCSSLLLASCEATVVVPLVLSQWCPWTNAQGWRVPGQESIINSSELLLACEQQVSNSLGSICCTECFPQKVARDALTLSGGGVESLSDHKTVSQICVSHILRIFSLS